MGNDEEKNDTGGAEPGEGHLPSAKGERLLDELKARTLRREREAGYRDRGFWTGVGVMGLVGWSVILPAVLGAYLGVLLDRELGLERTFSGGFALLGLCGGCWNAWRMVRKVLQPHEDSKMTEDEP
ncbi:MAG: AtpZ/AtpI family protein [Planctomycetota bacterium]|jgi:ATP synthase protein I